MVTLREMQVKDTEEVERIEAQIFSVPWTRQGFEDSLRLGHTYFLVAEENGNILGYAGIYFSIDEGEVTNVAVKKPERRRGIAQMLVAAMLKEAELRGIGKIVLEVRASNEDAIRLYERNGFRNCGTRKDFYEEPVEDAYIMIYGQ